MVFVRRGLGGCAVKIDHPLLKRETAEIPARELHPGSTLRYEPPEVAGRGYAALVLDSVEHGSDGKVTVEYSDGRLDYVEFDSESDLPPLIDDPSDLIEWPSSLSFDPDEVVAVEIQVGPDA